MSKTKGEITVRCTISGQCEVEIDPLEVEGMTDEEIRDWVNEGAHMEFWNQGRCDIRLCDFDSALKEYREE